MTRQGQQLSSDEEKILERSADYWRGVANEAPVKALTRIEEAAKQMIAITSALQGAYIAVFALSDLRKQLTGVQGFLPGWLLLGIFFLPLIFWLISLYQATRVFVPKVHDKVNLEDVSVGAWINVRNAYDQTGREKLRALQSSQRWLVVSFFVVLVVTVPLLLFLPAAATAPTQIIIVTPTLIP
jgi:hypothetical protein